MYLVQNIQLTTTILLVCPLETLCYQNGGYMS